MPIIIENLNNSITHLLSISSTDVIVKKMVIAEFSKIQNDPIRYDED